MFTKFTAIFTLAVAVVSVTAAPQFQSKNSCNTGPVQCCNSLQQVNNNDYDFFTSVLGVKATGLTGQLGFQCNPVTAIGKGGASSCTAAPSCCENVHQQSLIGINCSPTVINA